MSEVWDEAQTYHGGQEWSLMGDQYQCDFSVTTNAFGMPKDALAAAQQSLVDAIHYPPADFQPALSKLCAWLSSGAGVSHSSLKSRCLLGNGLSELIDMLTRQAPPGDWRGAGYVVGDKFVQYKEYQRSAAANGRSVLTPSDDVKRLNAAAITTIINPSNPTGDYMELEVLREYIEKNVAPGTSVFVDESMLPWRSPDWLRHSLVSQERWICDQLSQRNVAVYVLHSWTKIWACPGLRIGSVLTPNPELLMKLKSIQVPWSLNTAALAFLARVVDDTDYMQQTWASTRAWRQRTVDRIRELFPTWKVFGEPWLSWIWVDVGSPEEADRVVDAARAAGVPLRHGKFGYECHSHVRFAVRAPQYQDILFKSIKGS